MKLTPSSWHVPPALNLSIQIVKIKIKRNEYADEKYEILAKTIWKSNLHNQLMDFSNINTVYQSIKSNSKTQSSRKKEELRESINRS
ncbi:hypothetical protein EB796_002153 [Bugula neritina]|uniref:Uncharacterized protein n=1 Tax=Bugula neritina TaxID=10212 RepID=A0A7J7KN09_BUGNE|nr:hypothetical protein EB796_002153 [Bugula neritina]